MMKVVVDLIHLNMFLINQSRFPIPQKDNSQFLINDSD